MNVVQKQNAFAARLQPLHRGGDDPFRADTMMPIVGDRVGREDRKSAGGELAFEQIRSREAGDAEEWRHISCIAERGRYVGNTPVDLVAHFVDRQFTKASWVVLAMCADRVALLIDATHGGWESARHFADQEIGRDRSPARGSSQLRPDVRDRFQPVRPLARAMVQPSVLILLARVARLRIGPAVIVLAAIVPSPIGRTALLRSQARALRLWQPRPSSYSVPNFDHLAKRPDGRTQRSPTTPKDHESRPNFTVRAH